MPEAITATRERKPTELAKAPDLLEPVLDVVILGARLEEQGAIRDELRRNSDEGETRVLQERMKSYEGIPVHALKDLVDTSKTISVGVLECSEMGNLAAAINCAYAICRYRPSLIIFSGIAGALDTKKLRIGDVILPRSITTREFQKLKTGPAAYSTLSETEKMETLEFANAKLSTDTRTIDVSERARRLLSNIPPEQLEAQLLKNQMPESWGATYGVPMRSPHIVQEEAAFSWSKVLSNGPYVKFLKEHIGGAWTSVEMESYGFLRAVEKIRPIYSSDGIVVRSISDFAQHKELSDSDPQWRELALRNMAIATRYIIQSSFSLVY